MVSKQKLFSVCLFLFSFVSNSHIVQSSYHSHYFSNAEVFRLIRTKDEYRFNQWMRTYPEVNIFNECGQTPLMIAAQLQHFSFVTRLLDAGALRHYVDCFGYTARDYALRAENRQISSPDLLGAVSTGIVVGALVGLAAYALSDADVVARYDVAYQDHNDSYDYCMKCHCYMCYTVDPQELYCNSCYHEYKKQQNAYNSSPSSCRMSDLL